MVNKIVGSAVLLVALCVTSAYAKFTQDGGPCPTGQFECKYLDYKWCCDNDPEKSGGCTFNRVGVNGCCGKSDLPAPGSKSLCGKVS